MKGADGTSPQYLATPIDEGTDKRNHASYYPSVGSGEKHKKFLWRMLDNGAIVAESQPVWALSAHRSADRDRISDGISALVTHNDTAGERTYWHYFKLVRASGNNREYHIILDE